MPRQMIAGQAVIPKRIPGPMGFGFGSGHRPSDARIMIVKSGPHPRTTRVSPTLTQVLRR